VARGDVFELLLHGVEDRRGATRSRAPQLGRDVAPLGHGVGVLEEVLVGEVGDADRVLARQTVTGGQHGDARLVHQRPHAQPALVDRQAHIADVHPPVADGVGLVVPGRTDDLHRQAGVAFAQRPDRRSDDQPGHEPHGEGVGAACGAADPPAQRLGRGQQRAGVGEQLLARAGELGGPPVAHEELHLQLALQRPDLARQHGLRDVQRLGRPSEVQPLGHRDEISQLS